MIEVVGRKGFWTVRLSCKHHPSVALRFRLLRWPRRRKHLNLFFCYCAVLRSV